MSEILKGSFLTDKNGRKMEVVDAEAREKAAQNAEAISKLSEEMGNSVPETDQPHMQLVTDAEGKAVWEEKLAYKQVTESIFAAEQKVNTTKAPYGSSISGSGVCNGDIVYGKTYRVTFNGVDYNCVAHVGRNNMNFLGDSALSAANVSDGSDEFGNGEPFAVRTNAGVFYLFTESAGEYTVTISEIEEEVKRLDPDLLPEVIPSTDQPHMQLVTDANGEKKWEEKLAYENISNEVLLEDVQLSLWNDGTTEYTRTETPLYNASISNGDVIHLTVCGDFDYDGDIVFEEISETRWEAVATPITYGDGRLIVAYTTVFNESSVVFKVNGFTGDVNISVTMSRTERVIKPIPEALIPTTVPVIQSATVGQTLVVKAVDENGKPTEWEAVDAITAVVITKQNGVVSCNTPLENIAASIMKGTPWVYVRDDGESLRSWSDVSPNYVKADNVCFINVYGSDGSYFTGFEYNANGITESVDG